LKRLPSPWDDYAPILVIILRLAVIFHRNRHTFEMPDFKISFHKTHISLIFPPQWLANAPLTHADLVLETDYLEYAGFKLDYC
jgi:exopolyphosphatase / guanosine-5'-triphosphate,3'-diphosphate pyrophosphatase